MNEMLHSLGFNQITNTKWTNGTTMLIFVNTAFPNMQCYGDINDLVSVEYFIEKGELETMKRHVEKFMRMVGKCIQVDEE